MNLPTLTNETSCSVILLGGSKSTGPGGADPLCEWYVRDPLAVRLAVRVGA